MSSSFSGEISSAGFSSARGRGDLNAGGGFPLLGIEAMFAERVGFALCLLVVLL